MPTKFERDWAEFEAAVADILGEIETVESDIAEIRRKAASGRHTAAESRAMLAEADHALDLVSETLDILGTVKGKILAQEKREKAALRGLIAAIDKARTSVLDFDADEDEVEAAAEILEPAKAAADCFSHEDMFSGRGETLGRCYRNLHKAYKESEEIGLDDPNPFNPVFAKVEALYKVEGLDVPDDLYPFRTVKAKAPKKPKKKAPPKTTAPAAEARVFHARTRGGKYQIDVIDKGGGTYQGNHYTSGSQSGGAVGLLKPQALDWVRSAIDNAKKIDNINYIIKQDDIGAFTSTPTTKPRPAGPAADADTDRILMEEFRKAVLTQIRKAS